MLCIDICGIKFVVDLFAEYAKKIGGADHFFFVLFWAIKEVLIEVILVISEIDVAKHFL